MGLLPQGGINVAGHKIPWEAIGAIAALAGVFLVIRARQQGAAVASVGQQPAPTSAIDSSLSGFNPFSPDPTAALANIEQQLVQLQQTGVNSPSAPTPAASPSIPLAVPLVIPGVGHPGFVEGDQLMPHTTPWIH